MKITINQYDEETSISIGSDDLTSTEVLDKIRGLLVACGYNESNIIESFSELYEEHKFKLGIKDDIKTSSKANVLKSLLHNNLHQSKINI